MPIRMSTHMPVHMPIHMPIYMPIHMSAYMAGYCQALVSVVRDGFYQIALSFPFIFTPGFVTAIGCDIVGWGYIVMVYIVMASSRLSAATSSAGGGALSTYGPTDYSRAITN